MVSLPLTFLSTAVCLGRARVWCTRLGRFGVAWRGVACSTSSYCRAAVLSAFLPLVAGQILDYNTLQPPASVRDTAGSVTQGNTGCWIRVLEPARMYMWMVTPYCTRSNSNYDKKGAARRHCGLQ